MKRMLINATQKEELRVALVDGQRLYDLDIENVGREQKKSNIYKGKVIRIEPSLEAAFIDYGSEKHGFLSLKEISLDFFSNDVLDMKRPNIKNILYEGQELLVQINKDERGKKGAALTTFISLAGSYVVLMPNSPHITGISRQIEGSDRVNLKKMISLLDKPNSMGLIIRTAGFDKSIKNLQLDLNFQLKKWDKIKKLSKLSNSPALIHQESNIIIRAFRDYLCKDIKEIIIDNSRMLNLAHEYVSLLGRSDVSNKIKLYTGYNPIFSHYQIESQINSAFQRKVKLPSGGSIVVDTTEALTAIDINSERSTKGIDIEETALNTNLEAVDEISRQLRLRDLGGLIVIDFIDMSSLRHQKLIENRLRILLKKDRARIQIGSISCFGLLEMSRQRLNSSLKESSHYSCPRCNGTGTIRDNESLSLSILRLIEEEFLKENTNEVHAIVPVDIACYLLNEKRSVINSIENRKNGKKIIIIPNNRMKTPNYSILRLKSGKPIKSNSKHCSKFNKNKIIQVIPFKNIDNKGTVVPLSISLIYRNIFNKLLQYVLQIKFIDSKNYYLKKYLNIFLNSNNIYKIIKKKYKDYKYSKYKIKNILNYNLRNNSNHLKLVINNLVEVLHKFIITNKPMHKYDHFLSFVLQNFKITKQNNFIQTIHYLNGIICLPLIFLNKNTIYHLMINRVKQLTLLCYIYYILKNFNWNILIINKHHNYMYHINSKKYCKLFFFNISEKKFLSYEYLLSIQKIHCNHTSNNIVNYSLLLKKVLNYILYHRIKYFQYFFYIGKTYHYSRFNYYYVFKKSMPISLALACYSLEIALNKVWITNKITTNISVHTKNYSYKKKTCNLSVNNMFTKFNNLSYNFKKSTSYFNSTNIITKNFRNSLMNFKGYNYFCIKNIFITNNCILKKRFIKRNQNYVSKSHIKNVISYKKSISNNYNNKIIVSAPIKKISTSLFFKLEQKKKKEFIVNVKTNFSLRQYAAGSHVATNYSSAPITKINK